MKSYRLLVFVVVAAILCVVMPTACTWLASPTCSGKEFNVQIHLALSVSSEVTVDQHSMIAGYNGIGGNEEGCPEEWQINNQTRTSSTVKLRLDGAYVWYADIGDEEPLEVHSPEWPFSLPPGKSTLLVYPKGARPPILVPSGVSIP